LNACPLCGSPLYGWLALPSPKSKPTVGRPVDDDEGAVVFQRCENCGLGVEGDRPAGLELERLPLAITGEGEDARVTAPNRASWQAALGGEGWAGLDQRGGRLVLTPRALELLAERTGLELTSPVRCTRFGRNQAWMWQTLVNGLTFHPNFAREVRAGRLRPHNARNRAAFVIDAVVTVLAAPLVALGSVPLELVATLVGRGGEIVASVRA
jgi:hypothetical protein